MIEAALYTLLRDGPAVAALAAGRVYPLAAPQTPAAPFVVYQRISSQPLRALDGAVGRVQARFQVDCYAETYEAARALAAAVRATLDDFAGPVTLDGSPPAVETVRGASLQDEREFYDDTAQPRLYRVSADYFITYGG